MAPLRNMPPDNVDFNALLRSFDELGLLDQHIVDHHYAIDVDYTRPGPYPTHNLKTNFVRGHGLVRYNQTEAPLWPGKNRIMWDYFIAPDLPNGETPFNPTLLPKTLCDNPNISASGPVLLMEKTAMICIAEVSLRKGYVQPINIHIRHQNPFASVKPYTILYSEAKGLNSLYFAVACGTPTFPEFKDENLSSLMLQFLLPIEMLVAGIRCADSARPFLGGKGNRGWFHIFSLEFSPFMHRLRESVRNDEIGEMSQQTQLIMSDLIQAITVGILATDPRFEAAEYRRLRQEEEAEIAMETYHDMY